MSINKEMLMQQLIDSNIFDCSSNFANFRENVKNLFGFNVSESLLKELWTEYKNYGK